MKFSSRLAVAFGCGLASAVALLTALRATAFFTAFDHTVGYLASDTISTLLYIIPVLLSAAGILLVLFRTPTPPKPPKPRTPEERKQAKELEKLQRERIKALKRAGVAIPPEPEPTLSPALPRHRTPLTLTADLLCVIAFALTALLEYSLFTASANSHHAIRALLAVLSAVSFALPIAQGALAWLARTLRLSVVAWCIFCVAMDYFDWDVAMNSPIKVYGQLTLCLCILYLSAHVRLSLTDLALRRCCVFAVPTAVFGISFGIASLCSYPAGAYSYAALPTMTVCAALGLHAALSLIPLLRGEVATYLPAAPRELPTLPEQPSAAPTETTETTESTESTETTEPSIPTPPSEQTTSK